MDELKAVLGDDLFTQVVAKIGDKQLFVHDKGTKVLLDDGKLIPKYRLDEVAGTVATQKAQLEQYEKDMRALKKSAEGTPELTAKIEELQGAMKAARAEAEHAETRVRKLFALKEGLLDAGVVDAEARDLLSLRFDVEKLEVGEDGKVKGFAEMVKPYRENKAFVGMFGVTRKAGQQHADGELPDASLGEYGKNNPFAAETRNIAKQVELRRTQPELAARLQALANP
jgi:hypothetical protein